MRLKLTYIFVAILCIFQLVQINAIYADTTLANAADSVYTLQPNVSDVQHQIQFTVPLGSIINPSDYIIIQMPNYTGFNLSQMFISGSFVYGDSTGMHASLSGTSVLITNISVVQGNTIQINSLMAQNPATTGLEGETILVATDSSGSTVKNSASIFPTTFLGKEQVSTATATVAPYAATVTLSGYAYPGLFITVSESGNVVGTTTPDGTGFFQLHLTGLSPSTHSFDIYGIDSNSNTTAISTVLLYTPAYVDTIYQNLILSPILSVTPPQIHQGDTLTISGETVPSSTITISINSPLTQLAATSDTSGNFTYAFNQTTSMTPGQYSVNSIVQIAGSYQSIASPTVNFTILSGAGTNPSPACNISKGDLNCDGKVNLSDFSILMFYWGTTSKLADINGDGIVNLYDFSIMMYYFSYT